MSQAGFAPGPSEYHIAVVAQSLDGKVDQMLSLLHEQHARGGRALFETYKVLIRACVGKVELNAAKEAYEGAQIFHCLFPASTLLINRSIGTRGVR